MDGAPVLGQTMASLLMAERAERPAPASNSAPASRCIQGMNVTVKIPQVMWKNILRDLARPHAFAFERVGFIACRSAMTGDETMTLYGVHYEPVAEDEYLDDDSAVAVMGPAAIRRALRLALNEGNEDVSVLHVHHHFGRGVPRFSVTDARETKIFVPDFFHAAPLVPHGAIVFSNERAYGEIWLQEHSEPQQISEIISVGVPTNLLHI